MRLSLRIIAFVSLCLIPLLPGRLRAQSPSPRLYAVVIVLDGARPQYLNPTSMPNLRWLLARGVNFTQAFAGQEIANTPPSHATIGSGVFPSRHGVQGFEWKDPRTGAAIRPTDRTPVQNGALEAVLTAHHAPSLAAQVKATDPHDTVLSVSGHKCYASDAMGTASADVILCAEIYHDRWVAQAVGRHRPPPGAINNSRWDVPIPDPKSGFGPGVEQWQVGVENHWTMDYALWAFNRMHYPRVMMINLPETDVTGHFLLPHMKVEQYLMQIFDRDLGSLIAAYRRAGILNRTDFLITADHGMTGVTTRLPFAVLDRSIQQAGATKVYLEADTGAAIGIKELQKARAVALNVARLGGGSIDATYYKTLEHGEWSYRAAYVRSDLPYRVSQAYAMLMATNASADGPEVFAVYAPHVTTGDRISNGYHWLGGHLGPGWEDQHIPFVLAGAGIKHGVRSTYPARLVDIVPTLERLLTLQPSQSDGIVLANALVGAGHNARSKQQAVGVRLVPLVRALQERSLDR